MRGHDECEDCHRGEQEDLDEGDLERPREVLDPGRRHRRRHCDGQCAERQDPIVRVDPDGGSEPQREEQTRGGDSTEEEDARPVEEPVIDKELEPRERDAMLVVLREQVRESDLAAKATLDERELIPEVGKRNRRVAVDHDPHPEAGSDDESDRVERGEGEPHAAAHESATRS